jgi:hypothetical protein
VFKYRADMPDIRGQIEFLLIKIQMELDQAIMNEDVLTLEATADLRAFIAYEIDGLVSSPLPRGSSAGLGPQAWRSRRRRLRSAPRRYRRWGNPTGSTKGWRPGTDVQRIARDLNVRYVLTGAISARTINCASAHNSKMAPLLP